jgi:hypothetical protein
MSYRPPRQGKSPEPQQYASVALQSPPQSPQSRRSRSSRGAPSRVTTNEPMQQQYAPMQSPQSRRSVRPLESIQQQYASVPPQSPPQSPQSRRSRSTRGPASQAPTAITEEPVYASGSGRAGIIQGVATGHIGADYGPYSVRIATTFFFRIAFSYVR